MADGGSKKVHFKWPLEERELETKTKSTSQKRPEPSDFARQWRASRRPELRTHLPPKTSAPDEKCRVVSTRVTVRPGTLRSRRDDLIKLGKLKSSEQRKALESVVDSHDPSWTIPRPRRVASPPVNGMTSDSQVGCYGTPRLDRKKKHRSSKKPTPDSAIYDVVMADNEAARPVTGVEYTQISKRIVALTFPTTGSDSAYRHSIKEISDRLRKTYPEHYKIFNVSQKRSDLGKSNANAVVELGWPDQLAPPLDRLCSICKQIENWLSSNEDNVVVIHCKGWRSRAAIVIAAYMHYTSICGGEETVEDRFSMQIFSERFLSTDGQPSHKRYVRYFANLLSGATKVNPSPIYLTTICVHRIAGKGIVLKIYERMKPVFSSQATIAAKAHEARVDIDQGLSLRGDVIVKCFEKHSGSERSLLFQCQFNTCALDLSPENAAIHFYKQELDLGNNESYVDNQASVEFAFALEPPVGNGSISSATIAGYGHSGSLREKKAKSAKRSQSSRDVREPGISRADSYENFDRPEDDRSQSVPLATPVYTEVNKTLPPELPLHHPAQPSPLDGGDSGIGSDSPKHTSTMNGDIDPVLRSAYEDSTLGRDRSVLPAAVKPSSRQSQPGGRAGAVSPTESAATTHSTSRPLEPDLVGRDRYDPSSKCFSYVPAKALKEHYTTPKKPSSAARRASVERSNLDIPSQVDHDSLRQITITPTDLTKRPETPKWDAVIDNVAPKIDLPELKRDYRRDPGLGSDYFNASKTLPNGFNNGGWSDADQVQLPEVVNLARHTPIVPKRRGRSESYGAVNEDYNSDMDDLCDPDFYLTYKPTPTQTPTPARPTDLQRYTHSRSTEPIAMKTSRSVELPRKTTPANAISQRELDEIDDIIDTTVGFTPRAYTPKPIPVATPERDAFRQRNCRSVNSAPTRRLEATSAVDADNPDDWLRIKLRTLQSKRAGLPEVVARKNTERALLEELKNASNDKDPRRGEYVAEGYGTQANDLVEEYRREEERLRNTRSPFTSLDNGRVHQRGSTPNNIRTKPPTPPPRESHSPLRSPVAGRRSATLPTPRQSAYQQERSRIASTEYLSDDEDDGEFSHLSSLVPNSRSATTPRLPATKGILKHSGRQSQTGTPSSFAESAFDDQPPPSSVRDIYASPTTARRFGAQIPSEDSVSQQGGNNGGASSYPRVGAGSASSTPLPFASSRAETPAFPVGTRETPLPFHPLLYQGAAADHAAAAAGAYAAAGGVVNRTASPRSMYYGQSRRSSMASEGGEVIHHHPVFVKDTSKYWYKPNISREDAISMLRDKSPGTFVVRDSNSFPGAFGLALKVAHPPVGVAPGDGTELVRHFLIEPSPKGVKLKGCNNEPVFGTLAALVYQHSITPMALPCRLILPEFDPAATPEHLNAAQALLEQGAACNVTYMYSMDTESLTGPEAVRRAVFQALDQFARGTIRAVNVHFKVSAQGITLTDNTRSLFFRRHYPTSSVIFAGMDPEDRKWDNNNVAMLPPTYVRKARVFAFVARKVASRADNACHVFAELDPEQPATAVVNFITKVMMGQGPGQGQRARTLPPK